MGRAFPLRKKRWSSKIPSKIHVQRIEKQGFKHGFELIAFSLFAVGERFKCFVNSIVYGDLMTQVQLRLAQKTLEEIDRWVAEGRFKSRSDAIKTIISLYEEREKTREFFRMLMTRSEEAKKHPEDLVPLEEL